MFPDVSVQVRLAGYQGRRVWRTSPLLRRGHGQLCPRFLLDQLHGLQHEEAGDGSACLRPHGQRGWGGVWQQPGDSAGGRVRPQVQPRAVGFQPRHLPRPTAGHGGHRDQRLLRDQLPNSSRGGPKLTLLYFCSVLVKKVLAQNQYSLEQNSCCREMLAFGLSNSEAA
jgi:hypothetical protein